MSEIRFFILLILAFAGLSNTQNSTNQSPNNINTFVDISATNNTLQITQYFTFQQLSPDLYNSEWYAFLVIDAQQQQYWMKYHIYITTVSKQTGVVNPTKKECIGNHNDLHMCYFAGSEISIKQQNLQVDFIFQQPTEMKIKIEINTVRYLSVGEQFVMQKSNQNFTNIIRIDMRDIKDQFTFFLVEFGEEIVVDQYRNCQKFIASKEITPPDQYRYSFQSILLWDNVVGTVINFNDLKEIEYITFLMGITDQNTYVFKTSLIYEVAKPFTLQIGKKYHQLIPYSKAYSAQLPENQSNTTFILLKIHLNYFHELDLSNLTINGLNLAQSQIQVFLKQNGIIESNNQFSLKFNNTIYNLSFTLNFHFGNLITISLMQIDTQMIQLQPKSVWSDYLSFNQTQYLYFIIDTYKSEEKIDFQVELQVSYLSQYEVNFKNCVEKTVQQCKNIALSINQTLRLIGLTALTPQIIPKSYGNSYLFKNLTITKYQISASVYRSVFVIQMISKNPLLKYSVAWYMGNQIYLLKQNELNKMHGQEQQLAIYYFTIVDATNISFARIHYLSSSQSTRLFGTTTLIDLYNLQSINQELISHLIFSFQNSITFTNIQNATTYYVYVRSEAKCTYQITLTFGYNLDGNIQHPISFLTIGENSRTQLTIQPYQILFVQIRLEKSTFMHLSNSAPLKVCQFLQAYSPKTYQDMQSASYCTTVMTVNSLLLQDYNYSGKFFVGIQNQNNQTFPLQIITEVSLLRCNHVQMGKSHILMIHKNESSSYAYCVFYIITHKADIQILIDIQNPKLSGIALPTIKLGKSWKTLITSNIKIITGEEIDNYCLGQYEQCWLEINFQLDEDHHIRQKQISVTVSYTDQPLTLKDGLAHKSTIRPKQVKHFKYPLFNLDNLTATIKSNMGSLICYAAIVTNYDKFIYPEQEQALSNKSSQIYQSLYDSYFYPSYLTISQGDILKKCNSLQNQNVVCYVLFSVYGKQQTVYDIEFMIQVTQSISYLREGQRLEKYIQKYSKTYFNFKNNNNNTNLLFFTGSSSQDCLSMDVVEGNSQINKFVDIESGRTQVLLLNATEQWYSVVISARQNCYFTIQVSASKRPIREVSLGYSHLISLGAGQKIYYIMPNEELTLIKLIVSMKLQKMGEVIIRGIPVTNTQLSDFIKFINEDLEINKRTNLSYAWIDTNSLTIRQSDRHFCKNCHICIQIQGSKAMEGYLTIPQTPNSISFHLPGTTSSDILLKGQYYKWQFTYIFAGYNLIIKIQAGSIQIDISRSFSKQINSIILTFDKINYVNNQIQFEYSELSVYNSDITITALQNSVYSISSKELLTIKDDFYYIQVGKPEYIYLFGHNPSCYAGELANQYQEFILTVSRSGYDAINAEDVSSKLLQITATVNSQSININKEIIKNVIILSFDEESEINNQPFKICLRLKQEAEEQYFDGRLMFLGNLNYIPQDFSMHFRKNRNLTFMSEGKGIIEVDQCGSRSVLTLSSRYQDINNMNSKITQRRIANNLIAFDHYGPVYLNTESKDYVTLRWRNYQYEGNGKGYQIFSPSTFRILYNASNQQLSVTIKPIQNTSDEFLSDLQIAEVIYQVYIAKQESDLYNAMNCERGDYMFWVKRIQTAQQMTQESSMKLNNINDLKTVFKKSSYVLIIVRAEVMVRWNYNNATQNYRFYYPYQEMLLSQFSASEVSKQIGATPSNQNQNQNQSQSSSNPMIWVIFTILVIVIILLIVIVICVVRKLQKRVQRFDLMQQEQMGNSEVMTTKIGTETDTKIQPIEMQKM